MTVLRRFWKGECGQDLVEYTLLVAFVVLGSAGLMMSSGPSVAKVWTATNNALVAQPVSSPPATNPDPTPPSDGGGDHRDGHDR